MSTEVLHIDGEAVNTETGEIVPFPAPPPPVEFHGYFGAGTLALTEVQAKVLTEALPDEDHSILPTGEVYVSQVHVRRKLSAVFGPGGWSLVPRGPYTNQNNTICREYALVCLGRFVAEAIGEAEYHPDNHRMSYASACEAAKSNALTRCAKDLSIASECWEKRYTERFKAEYCVKVWREKAKRKGGGVGEYQWRLRDSEPFWDEKGQARQERRPAPPVQADEPDYDHEDPELFEGHPAPPPTPPAPKMRAQAPKAQARPAQPVAPSGPTCPMCGTPGKLQAFQKPGKTHFCPSCAHAWEPAK